jgi:RNA polymerase sigma-70 factor (ECF subfamily)
MVDAGTQTSAYNAAGICPDDDLVTDPATTRSPEPPVMPSLGGAREMELIRRILSGDRSLFYELIQPYERVVFLAANSILQNDADAEEVAQESFLRALEKLATFRGEARFSTWLVQIAINDARMRLRRSKRYQVQSADEPVSAVDDEEYFPRDLADWREIPSEALERKELREALKRAVASLKPHYRDVFLLRDVQHLSIAETAKALGLKEATVKVRLLRARLMMRDALAPGYDGSWTIGETGWKKVRPW